MKEFILAIDQRRYSNTAIQSILIITTLAITQTNK